MGKRQKRREPSLPPVGDVGPDTAAQRNGTVIVRESEPNGTRYQRKRRDHMLTRMYGKGSVNKRQLAAGLELHDRYEQTMRSPELAWARGVYVDSTPKPGDISTAQLEAKARWTALSRHIPRDCRAIVMAVCIHETPIRPGFTRAVERARKYASDLRRALDAVANEMRI